MDDRENSKVGKIILIIVLAAIILGFVIYFIVRGIGDNDDLTTNPTSNKITTQSTTNGTSDNNGSSTTETAEEMTIRGELGTQTVEIQDKRLVKEENGKDAIIISYKVTNNGNAAMNFLTVLSDSAHQGEEKLNDAVLKDIENFDVDSIRANIAKGESYTVQKAFILKDMTTPVKIEVKQIASMNGKMVTKTFEIQ